jgi:tungstate transport system substrate-binding protein
MADTLQFANESSAYTLTDRGTYLALQDGLSNLEVLVGGPTIDENGDPALLNPYGVIPVNPDKGNIASDLAHDFITWLTSLETQELIAEFGTATYGQPLFYPDSEAWRSR